METSHFGIFRLIKERNNILLLERAKIDLLKDEDVNNFENNDSIKTFEAKKVPTGSDILENKIKCQNKNKKI